MQNYLLQDENALYYECGYSCDHALYLKLGSEAFFITDGRYTTEAESAVKGAEVVEGRNLLKIARQILRKHKVKTLHFNPHDLSAAEYNDLRKKLSLNLQANVNFSQKKRIIKTDEEVELIRESVRLNREAFEHFANYLGTKGIGASEKSLHFEAKAFLSQRGNLDLSFDPIVGINGNAAKPHAIPTDDLLKEGDLLLFDAGVKYKRYCSDRTRTSQIGSGMDFCKAQTYSDPKRQKIYDTVLKAQEKAIEGVRCGMKAKEVDKLARDVITEAGYGDYFVHSLGHGVGLDIHELPTMSARSETVIEDGMVFTIEPGIYFAGEFGVRIEDIVVMKNGRAEVL